MNHRVRRRYVVAQEPIEIDYLASRGYPLSAHNRSVVVKLIESAAGTPERKALFQYLDAHLLPNRR